MLGFPGSSYLRAEAKQIVNDFVAACPPPSKPGIVRVSGRQVESSLDALYRKAAELSRERRLWVFGRARFAKALQDELRNRGYPPELVARVVSAVTVNSLITTPPKRD